jgi:hypothetical protein
MNNSETENSLELAQICRCVVFSFGRRRIPRVIVSPVGRVAMAFQVAFRRISKKQQTVVEGLCHGLQLPQIRG